MLKNILFIYALGALSGVTAAQAGTDAPEEALRQFEHQLNSRCYDVLIGAVDYELVYTKQSTSAYPLTAVQEAQAHCKAKENDPNRFVPERDVKALHAPVLSKPSFATKANRDSTQTGREADANLELLLTAVAGDTGKVAPSPDLPAAPLEAVASVKARMYQPSFIPDSSRMVGPHPPKVRFYGDRAGDPLSFDLSGMDIERLLSRPFSRSFQGLGEVVLGIRMVPPSTRNEGPEVTRMEEEHSLAERRGMRLALREYYGQTSAGVFLEMEVKELKVEGDRAIALVQWGFTDQKEMEKGEEQLVLVKTATGWKISRSWDFLEKVIASR